ncbi:MAG: amidohydrolase family protein, partial [Spirochaetales bacterium]|nr:amidohydrolase family protein [Spirochaetales bacterium]
LVQNTAALRELASINNPGARILGLNFEGPYLNPKYGSRRDNVLLPDPDLYEKIINEAGPLAKIMTVAPELEGARELISFLNKRGVIISVGHTEANEDELNFAVHHGARLATHMYNAMGQPIQEKGGVKPVGLEERLLGMDEVTAEIIADERAIHVAPFHLKNLLAIKGYERVILISDSIPMTGTDQKEYTSADGRTFIHDADLRIVKSTGDISGSLITLDLGVANMMKHTGVPLAHAITMASYNPARLLKLDHRKGSISIGMDADLMVIDEHMKVYMTFVEGEPAFNELTA